MTRFFNFSIRGVAALAVVCIGLLGCGSDESPSAGNADDAGGGTDTGGTGGTGNTGGTGSGSAFTPFMGSSKLLIGAQMDDATAASAPFDARYLYLAGAPASPAACMSSCTAASSCSNWWGCWQDQNQPPGQYPTWHLQRGASATWQGSARPQIPIFTYYLWLGASGGAEGSNEVAAMNDAVKLGRYLDDWRFLLQRIGNQRAMLHIEPDLWGFLRSTHGDPHAVPAKVQEANPTDCAAQENSAAGLARCMIAMARSLAPNATVGLHASPWLSSSAGDGVAVGQFMRALGADGGDFVVTDPSDRDAGWYEAQGQNRWWNDAAAAAYLAWSKDLAETVGKPTVMWQIPLGNMAQDNTVNHWKDNRVDYLFSHLDEVVDAHVAALLFGAGHHEQTTPETDGGNLVSKTLSNWQAGGKALR